MIRQEIATRKCLKFIIAAIIIGRKNIGNINWAFQTGHIIDFNTVHKNAIIDLRSDRYAINSGGVDEN